MDALRDALAVVARDLRAEDTAAVSRAVVEIVSALPGARGATVLVDGVTVAALSATGAAADLAFTDGPVVLRGHVDGAAPELELLGPVLARLISEAARRQAEGAAHRKLTHDLRGSLAVVSGQCEMLETGVWGEPTPEQARSIGTIARHVDRMGALLDLLRDSVSR